MTARPEMLLAAAEIRDQLPRLQREVDDIVALTPSSDAPDRTSLWALAAHLQAYYSGCKSCLQRALAPLDGQPHGADSHVRLLRAAGLEIPGLRPAILRAATMQSLDAYRAFRHFFRHGYGVELDWARMESKARSIRSVHAEFARDLADFCAFLDAAGTA